VTPGVTGMTHDVRSKAIWERTSRNTLGAPKGVLKQQRVAVPSIPPVSADSA